MIVHINQNRLYDAIHSYKVKPKTTSRTVSISISVGEDGKVYVNGKQSKTLPETTFFKTWEELVNTINNLKV